jgi:hypothetical protein
MKNLLVLFVFGVAMSFSHGHVLFDDEYAKAADHDILHEPLSANLQQDVRYVILGELYYEYTVGDKGDNYEPYGSVNIRAGVVTQNIWDHPRSSFTCVPLGQSNTQGFGFESSSISPLEITGFIHEVDGGGDDRIADIDQVVNTNDVTGGKVKTYRFESSQNVGFATVTLRVLSCNA